MTYTNGYPEKNFIKRLLANVNTEYRKSCEMNLGPLSYLQGGNERRKEDNKEKQTHEQETAVPLEL